MDYFNLCQLTNESNNNNKKQINMQEFLAIKYEDLSSKFEIMGTVIARRESTR